MASLKKHIFYSIKEHALFASSLFMAQHDKLFKFLEGRSPHEYSKIMDEVYNRTHIGGGFHRSFDGSHTLKGSHDVIKDRVGSVDPAQYVEAHARELVTPEGIPLFTLDKGQHDALSNDISNALGGKITAGEIRAYLRDINSVNAGDLCAAGLGAIFVVAAIHSGDSKAISRVTAANICMGLASANPAMLLLGVGSLAYGVYQNKIQSWEMLKGAAPVIAGIIGYHTASKLFYFNKTGGIVFAIGTSIASSMLIAHLEKRKQAQVIEELGEENPQYITALTPDLLKAEMAMLLRKTDPLGLGGQI